MFSLGIDLIHEFFNLERKTKSEFLSKSIQYFNKKPVINKIFTKIADQGLLVLSFIVVYFHNHQKYKFWRIPVILFF